ncbi:hypothetical protein BGX30_003204 [Mortierella sp. GBA39]|nr:hypothetical protein BGX30_003204 [Mortierella sp. GBA39]
MYDSDGSSCGVIAAHMIENDITGQKTINTWTNNHNVRHRAQYLARLMGFYKGRVLTRFFRGSSKSRAAASLSLRDFTSKPKRLKEQRSFDRFSHRRPYYTVYYIAQPSAAKDLDYQRAYRCGGWLGAGRFKAFMRPKLCNHRYPDSQGSHLAPPSRGLD